MWASAIDRQSQLERCPFNSRLIILYKYHAVIEQLSPFPPNPWDKHTDHSTKIYTVHPNNANFFLKRGVFFWHPIWRKRKETRPILLNVTITVMQSSLDLLAETSLITLTKTLLNYLHCLGQGLKLHLFTHNQHSTTGGLWSRQFPPFLWTTDRFSPIHVQGQWHLIQELHVHVQYQINIFTGIHKAHFLWKLMQSVVAIF